MRIVVIDDEPPARELLLGYAAARPDMTIVGEAEDGPAALELIRRVQPDVALVDVQMPGMDGFDVIAQCEGLPSPPRVVFVTAYDRHAIRAFEVNAVDYLLKPVSRDRFDRAIERCLETSRPRPAVGRFLEDVARLVPPRLVIRDRGRITLLPVASVDRVESEGDYVRVHTGSRSHLLERTLADMEALLVRHGFARIHRSAIVNLDRIKELYPEGSGRYRLRLVDGTELVVSRSYSHVFRQQVL